jgi:hypothetical protein
MVTDPIKSTATSNIMLAANKLSQPQQQPAAVATASLDYQVNKMVRLANLIAKKYEY